MLTPGFYERVISLKAILDEVYPKSIEDWMEGFELDGNPETELLVMECMALTYRNFTDGRTLDTKAKKEVFKLTVQCSLGLTEEY